MKQTALFEQQWGKDNSPPDPTEITQVILYYDKPEVAEFKKLAKMAIKDLYPNDYQERGNVSDAILLLLRKNYANTTT